MGDNSSSKPWHKRKKKLDNAARSLERQEPRMPECHEFNKVYAEYEKRKDGTDSNLMSRLVSMMSSRHDPYVSNPAEPLLKKVRDASEEYGRKLAEYYKESGHPVSAIDMVILSQGLFAQRFYGSMTRNLEGFIRALSSASFQGLEIDVVRVTSGVEHEEGELGLTFPREWSYREGTCYSFEMPDAEPNHNGVITTLEYSLKDPQAIRIGVKKHLVTIIDSNSREEQKPVSTKGSIRIPLIHILGDNCRGFGEVRKDPQIIVRYAGVVIYQQPEVSVPSISQGKGKPPIEPKEKDEIKYRGGRDKVLLPLE